MGGTGDDIYVVGAGGTISELSGEGTDEVRSSVSYTLGASLENLVLTGLNATTGTGNDLNNSITVTQSENGVSLFGLGGDDSLFGYLRDNLLDGGDGDDYLGGGVGNDTLHGGAGADWLDGGYDQDRVFGGDGDDLIVGTSGGTIVGASDDDVLNGGPGVDTVTYARASSFVDVDLAVTTARSTGGGGRDTIVEIENLIGSSFADRLVGDAGANRIEGGDGDDTIFARTGNDTLSGGVGLDILSGGAGADTFVDTASSLNGDTITDFARGDRIIISDATLAGFEYHLSGNVLSFTGGSVTLSNLSLASISASSEPNGGVQISWSGPPIVLSAGPSVILDSFGG